MDVGPDVEGQVGPKLDQESMKNSIGNSKKLDINKKSVVVGISGRMFEFPVERSKSGKTTKFQKTGHPKNSVAVGISGRTFKIQKKHQNSKKLDIRKVLR